MTISSNQAFHDKGNKKRRLGTKVLILDFLEANKDYAFTYEDISKHVEGYINNINNTQKRCSDLYKEGKIEIVGTKDGKSLYKFLHIDLFPVTKLTSIKTLQRAIEKYVDDSTYESIIKEYSALRKFR